MQQRYQDFAVFRENTAIPEEVFETFWRPLGFTKYDTQDSLDLFVNRCLARRDERNRITLHDLQVAYVLGKVGAANLPELHNRLLF